MKNNKLTGRQKRKVRIMMKIKGTKDRPRLSVFRSNRYIYAQIIDDGLGKTLTQSNSKELKSDSSAKLKRIDQARLIGKKLAEKAMKLNIKTVVFDRSGYEYHGLIAAVADGAREGGLLL